LRLYTLFADVIMVWFYIFMEGTPPFTQLLWQFAGQQLAVMRHGSRIFITDFLV
jgi:hypothetical protein